MSRALATEPTSPEALARAVAACRNCELWEDATHGVPGRGPAPARVMLVGEQPGDQEDRAGEPFVGPAGRILHAACEQAGLAEDKLYVTNAVKHFRFLERGKRRIHQRPERSHVAACHPWLTAEIGFVRPEVIVALGATATEALLGPGIKITESRGIPQPSELAKLVLITAHPSQVLRIPDREARHRAQDALVADLEKVSEWLRQNP